MDVMERLLGPQGPEGRLNSDGTNWNCVKVFPSMERRVGRRVLHERRAESEGPPDRTAGRGGDEPGEVVRGVFDFTCPGSQVQS